MTDQGCPVCQDTGVNPNTQLPCLHPSHDAPQQLHLHFFWDDWEEKSTPSTKLCRVTDPDDCEACQ